jgi:hypothetical protein
LFKVCENPLIYKKRRSTDVNIIFFIVKDL